MATKEEAEIVGQIIAEIMQRRQGTAMAAIDALDEYRALHRASRH